LIVNLDGKTGARRVRIITTVNSVKFLKEWLLIHEKDPESYLFQDISDVGSIKKISIGGLLLSG
jgi:hypothetical protein